MNVSTLVNKSLKTLRDNSPTILTALGVSGTLSTAYLSAKAAVKAQKLLDYSEVKLTFKEKVRIVWKDYIPPAASGAVTIVCIIGAQRASSSKTAAAYSLLTASQAAFTEYKEKVVEQLGENKEKAIRDGIAQDRVSKTAPSTEVVLVGSGSVLCYEMYTGRYFQSSIEQLKKAVNEVNAKMVRETEATLSDFYYLIGLPTTSVSDRSGWDNCRLLELSFSTTMAPDDRPCVAFEYNYIEPF